MQQPVVLLAFQSGHLSWQWSLTEPLQRPPNWRGFDSIKPTIKFRSVRCPEGTANRAFDNDLNKQLPSGSIASTVRPRLFNMGNTSYPIGRVIGGL